MRLLFLQKEQADRESLCAFFHKTPQLPSGTIEEKKNRTTWKKKTTPEKCKLNGKKRPGLVFSFALTTEACLCLTRLFLSKTKNRKGQRRKRASVKRRRSSQETEPGRIKRSPTSNKVQGSSQIKQGEGILGMHGTKKAICEEQGAGILAGLHGIKRSPVSRRVQGSSQDCTG